MISRRSNSKTRLPLRVIVGLMLLIATITAVGWWIARHDRAFDPKAETTPPPPGFGGQTMGGTWSVRLRQSTPKARLDTLQRNCQATLDQLEQQMSTWRSTSDVSKFNASSSLDWQPVPRELAEVVIEAQRIAALTGGAFDITIAPVVNAWGFGPGPANDPARRGVPKPADLQKARAAVGHANLQVRLDPPALRKLRADVQIDLSAIAQGYAVDQLFVQLQQEGIADMLVEVCGEMRAAGVAPAGRPWQVGVESPRPETYRIFRRLKLPDIALATSGDYRNYFEIAGVRYSHEIDPRTGMPISHALASVSVAHASAATADALATALLVLGPEAGVTFAREQHLPAMFIVRDGDTFRRVTTPEFESMLLPADSATDEDAGK